MYSFQIMKNREYIIFKLQRSYSWPDFIFNTIIYISNLREVNKICHWVIRTLLKEFSGLIMSF